MHFVTSLHARGGAEGGGGLGIVDNKQRRQAQGYVMQAVQEASNCEVIKTHSQCSHAAVLGYRRKLLP